MQKASDAATAFLFAGNINAGPEQTGLVHSYFCMQGDGMGSFIKGMTFTMEGKEYEVVNEGTNDPASCLVYVLSQEKETADPQTLRMWKAEAKLARGDIMISGYSEESGKQPARDSFYPPVTDPLEKAHSCDRAAAHIPAQGGRSKSPDTAAGQRGKAQQAFRCLELHKIFR